jgi:hypothetical protein
MPSTVYKGDLTEISFGHETALELKHGGFGSSFLFKHVSTDSNSNTSVIGFEGGGASLPCTGGLLKYPVGMLVGCKISIVGITNFTLDDSHNTGRTYTVLEHKNHNTNKTQLTVTPALKTGTSVDSGTNDVLIINSFGTPTFDANMAGWNITAASSSERVLTDQFLGLAAAVTLPETKVDLKRYHIVGLGRDTAIQVPGRFLNEGGSFEVNLHNPRWLYYCLGMESISYMANGAAANLYDSLMSATRTLNGAVEKGQSLITVDGALEFTDAANPLGAADSAAAGDYILIRDTTVEDIITHREGTTATGAAFGAVNIEGDDFFDTTQKNEIRRIAAIDGNTIFLDDGLCYSHADSCQVRIIRFQGDGGGATNTGSPHRESTGAITFPISRLLYSRDSVPSFAMEVSIRRSDVEGADADVTDGGATDPKQLTRVFKGCKVKDFSMTADTDAALRLSVNFDSSLCYTDTGRLETSGSATDFSSGTKGDRYKTHRMFEETASTLAKRKEAGIEKGTQKPFMFYNGTVVIAGVNVAQVVSFTITGNTGVQQFYTINGAATSDSVTDQIPFGGSRNASLAVEGKTEYSMDCEIIVEDPVMYHKVRRAIDHPSQDGNLIRLSFTKPGSASTREQIDIILDDFYIVEAPLPIPEDKGVIKSALKILPKALRVVSRDSILHS